MLKKSKTWEFCKNLLTKSGMVFNSVKKLPFIIEKEVYNPCSLIILRSKYLIQEFEESFWEVENIVCSVDKLLEDIEYTYILQLVYSIKTIFDILNENNLITLDKKKLQLNQKKTEEYIKKRDQKLKEGVQINQYLDKSSKEEQKAVQDQYGLQFQDWEKNLIQIERDINILKGKEKKQKWTEQRELKKNYKINENKRDIDDFERYKSFVKPTQGIQQTELVRVNYLKDIQSKRERINNSTEIKMIEKKEIKSRNKSMIQEEVEKTKSEISFKKALEKKVVEEKKLQHIEILESMKEKRKIREKQIEELKKTEKEEKVWRRAQELLEKQSKLLYEREQLLQNKQYF